MFKNIRRKAQVFSANMAYQRRKLFYPHDATRQREMIHAAIKRSGFVGMTRDQIVVETGIPLQSVTWRVRELVTRKEAGDYGSVWETGFAERITRQGGIAKVLFAA